MKYTNLFLVALMFIVLAACGKKEEKKEPTGQDMEEIHEIAAQDVDSADFQEFYESPDQVTDGDKQETEVVEEEKPVEKPKADEELIVNEKPKVEKPKVEVKKHQKRYYVVVGSFKKYKNAKNLESKFKAKGYKTWVLPKVDDYNRVAIVSYAKEADARKAVKKLRVEHNDVTFWLYRW